MTELIESILRGIPFGCVFGLLAVGLVLVYRTTGVFNLAFGAQAFVSAAVFYDLRVRHGWAIVPAFVVAVVLIAPLLGLLLDRLLFRNLRSAPVLARLVVALGLLVAIPQIVTLWFGRGPAFDPPSLSPAPDHIYRFWGQAIDGNDIVTMATTLLIVVALTVLLRFTALGLRMRAVVESHRMAELFGIPADRVSATAWMLSSFVAGVAGVLLSPLFAQVDATSFTTLLVAAIAAAALGGLRSIPLAFVGGLLLGIFQQVIATSLPLDSVLAAGLRPSLPFFVLFALLVVRAGSGEPPRLRDPLAGVDPPTAVLAGRVRSEPTTRRGRATVGFVVVALLLVVLTVFDAFWLDRTTQAVIFATIFLSITVVSGMAGQVSLCQATFAAIGGFATAQLATEVGLSPVLAIIVGVALAGAVGVLLAVPALRLGIVELALATLAFALMFEAVIEPLDWVSGGILPVGVTRPVLGPIDFADDRSFFLLCVVVLAAVSFLVVHVRRGPTGRFLRALAGSDVAARAVGVGPVRPKVVAFGLSAAIAALGGALLAVQQGEANPASFVPFLGLFWVVLVVVVGSRSVTGAIVAGAALIFLPELLDRLDLSTAWLFIGFGLATISFARHPEGILEAAVGALSARFGRPRVERPARSAPTVRPAGGIAPGSVSLPDPLLEIHRVTKTYDGLAVLNDVSMSVGPGEFVGLIGPNGSGKTTLFDCLDGLVELTAGRLRFAGRNLDGVPAHARARLGMARTFQQLEMFGGMTVREHLEVAACAHTAAGGFLAGVRRQDRLSSRDQALLASVLELLRLADDAERPIEALPLGRARLVDVGRALMVEPTLLLLDEPSSGLDPDETGELGQVIVRVSSERGTAVLLVEHDLALVRQVTTRLCVLETGRLVADGSTSEVLSSDLVRAVYLGL